MNARRREERKKVLDSEAERWEAKSLEELLSELQEAQAYLDHPILGARLRECCRLVNLVEGRSIEQIFGYPDDLKFRSSMTLFAHAAADNQIFLDALAKYFNGEFDPLTLERL